MKRSKKGVRNLRWAWDYEAKRGRRTWKTIRRITFSSSPSFKNSRMAPPNRHLTKESEKAVILPIWLSWEFWNLLPSEVTTDVWTRNLSAHLVMSLLLIRLNSTYPCILSSLMSASDQASRGAKKKQGKDSPHNQGRYLPDSTFLLFIFPASLSDPLAII